jgi:hypothetical protein
MRVIVFIGLNCITILIRACALNSYEFFDLVYFAGGAGGVGGAGGA